MELLLSIHTDIMIFRIFFTLGFMLAIDLYAYQAFKTVFRSSATPYIYWGITVAYIIFAITLALMMTSGKVEYRYLGLLMGASILLAVPKLIAIGPLLIEDVVRVSQFLFRGVTTQPTLMPERRAFISKLALGLAAIPFLGIIDGIWKGMMAMAGKITVAEVEELVEVGELDPNSIHIPGIFVQRIFQGVDYEKRIEQRTVRAKSE